jgi:hypothetical protein
MKSSSTCLRWVLCALLCVGLVGFSAADLSAQGIGGGSTGLKENLDLPFDAVGESESEEDAPEVVIFYGTQLEGDGFFYTIDRSGSMQDSGELGRAKQEVSRNISEFSARTQFGVVFFDLGLQRFPSSGRPVEASASMKSAALGWITGMRGGRGSCCQLGLLTALRYANMSSAKRKVIVYVGDGGGTCNGESETAYHARTLQAVASQNYQRAQINAVGVLMGGRTNQERFLQNLVRQHGGTYKRIN